MLQQLAFHKRQTIKSTRVQDLDPRPCADNVHESVLAHEMTVIELSEILSRTLAWKPLAYLRHIKSRSNDDRFLASQYSKRKKKNGRKEERKEGKMRIRVFGNRGLIKKIDPHSRLPPRLFHRKRNVTSDRTQPVFIPPKTRGRIPSSLRSLKESTVVDRSPFPVPPFPPLL